MSSILNRILHKNTNEVQSPTIGQTLNGKLVSTNKSIFQQIQKLKGIFSSIKLSFSKSFPIKRNVTQNHSRATHIDDRQKKEREVNSDNITLQANKDTIVEDLKKGNFSLFDAIKDPNIKDEDLAASLVRNIEKFNLNELKNILSKANLDINANENIIIKFIEANKDTIVKELKNCNFSSFDNFTVHYPRNDCLYNFLMVNIKKFNLNELENILSQANLEESYKNSVINSIVEDLKNCNFSSFDAIKDPTTKANVLSNFLMANIKNFDLNKLKLILNAGILQDHQKRNAINKFSSSFIDQNNKDTIVEDLKKGNFSLFDTIKDPNIKDEALAAFLVRNIEEFDSNELENILSQTNLDESYKNLVIKANNDTIVEDLKKGNFSLFDAIKDPNIKDETLAAFLVRNIEKFNLNELKNILSKANLNTTTNKSIIAKFIEANKDTIINNPDLCDFSLFDVIENRSIRSRILTNFIIKNIRDFNSPENFIQILQQSTLGAWSKKLIIPVYVNNHEEAIKNPTFCKNIEPKSIIINCLIDNIFKFSDEQELEKILNEANFNEEQKKIIETAQKNSKALENLKFDDPQAKMLSRFFARGLKDISNKNKDQIKKDFNELINLESHELIIDFFKDQLENPSFETIEETNAYYKELLESFKNIPGIFDTTLEVFKKEENVTSIDFKKAMINIIPDISIEKNEEFIKEYAKLFYTLDKDSLQEILLNEHTKTEQITKQIELKDQLINYFKESDSSSFNTNAQSFRDLGRGYKLNFTSSSGKNLVIDKNVLDKNKTSNAILEYIKNNAKTNEFTDKDYEELCDFLAICPMQGLLNVAISINNDRMPINIGGDMYPTLNVAYHSDQQNNTNLTLTVEIKGKSTQENNSLILDNVNVSSIKPTTNSEIEFFYSSTLADCGLKASNIEINKHEQIIDTKDFKLTNNPK